MGEVKDKKIREFLAKLKKHFKPEKVILFGSRAGKDYLKDSDYDFIIVSEEFKKYDFLERISQVIKKCRAYFSADLLCYTPKEFNKKRKQIGIVSTAVKEGKNLI
ncbi:MAG: nucleotidyltransferase domain-containing protein [Candidatus Diapherotrites archaeon]